jgi:hypothetical protein
MRKFCIKLLFPVPVEPQINICFSRSLNDKKKLNFLEVPFKILPILIDPSFEALNEGISSSINDLSILKQFSK